MLIIYLSFFIFGLIIGSFLNVFICRYHTGRSLRGRSMCLMCNKQLSWFELIPLVSYLLQGGRCRLCKSRISSQYPLVELTTGLVFAGISWKFLTFNFQLSIFNLSSLIYFILVLLIFSILIVISAYDIRHKIIPNGPVYTFILLAILTVFVDSQLLIVNGLLDHILAGIVLSLPFVLLWLFSRGKLMGLGDAKLALGMGFLLGLSAGVTALLLSFWIGAIISLLLIAFSRLFSASVLRYTMKSEIPFGPFLALSTFIVFLFDIDFISLIQIFT